MKLKKVKIGNGYHYTVSVMVNGEPVIAIIDSGANCTTFQNYSMEGVSIKFGRLRFLVKNTKTIPWGRITQAYTESGQPVPELIIGTDILNGCVIDLKKNILSY